MEPTKKSDAINKTINETSGDNREEAIQGDRCIKPPIGCGQPALDFRDEKAMIEFRISGLCQQCQDRFFGTDDDDSEDDDRYDYDDDDGQPSELTEWLDYDPDC